MPSNLNTVSAPCTHLIATALCPHLRRVKVDIERSLAKIRVRRGCPSHQGAVPRLSRNELHLPVLGALAGLLRGCARGPEDDDLRKARHEGTSRE